MEKHILVIEDSQICQQIALESLKHLGTVEVAMDCQQAMKIIATHRFDFVLIDVHLPDGNGIELMGQIRSHKNSSAARVIFASGDEDLSKKIAAFSIGADDYLTKPYSPLELRARADRLFRRESDADQFTDVDSGLKLNGNTYRVTIEGLEPSKAFDLSPHEFKILNLLIRNPDRIYSRNQIIDIIWGHGVFISERTVDAHVSSIRKKMGPLNRQICAVRGEGYRWTAKAGVV